MEKNIDNKLMGNFTKLKMQNNLKLEKNSTIKEIITEEYNYIQVLQSTDNIFKYYQKCCPTSNMVYHQDLWNDLKLVIGKKLSVENVDKYVKNMIMECQEKISKEEINRLPEDFISKKSICECIKTAKKTSGDRRIPYKRAYFYKISFALNPSLKEYEKGRIPHKNEESYSHQALFEQFFGDKLIINDPIEYCMLYCKYHNKSYCDALKLFLQYQKQVDAMSESDNTNKTIIPTQSLTNQIVNNVIIDSKNDDDFIDKLVNYCKILKPDITSLKCQIERHMAGTVENLKKIYENDEFKPKEVIGKKFSINPIIQKNNISKKELSEKSKEEDIFDELLFPHIDLTLSDYKDFKKFKEKISSVKPQEREKIKELLEKNNVNWKDFIQYLIDKGLPTKEYNDTTYDMLFIKDKVRGKGDDEWQNKKSYETYRTKYMISFFLHYFTRQLTRESKEEPPTKCLEFMLSLNAEMNKLNLRCFDLNNQLDKLLEICSMTEEPIKTYYEMMYIIHCKYLEQKISAYSIDLNKYDEQSKLIESYIKQKNF